MNLKTDSGSQIVADYPKYKDESNKNKQIRAIFIRFLERIICWLSFLFINYTY